MKAMVSVCRIAYAFKDIEVEIPESELVAQGRDGVVRPMSPDQVVEAFKRAAENKAGDYAFSEKSSEYQAQVVDLFPGKAMV